MTPEKILTETASVVDLSRKMREYAGKILTRERDRILDLSEECTDTEARTALQVSYEKITNELKQ